MGQHAVLLEMPDELYRHISQIAEETNQPLENVLLDSLTILFGEWAGDTRLTPESLEMLTDAQLWAIVYRHLAWSQDARLRELTSISKERALSQDETAEIERLVEAVDHYVLLRSKALLLLKERGQDVERRLRLGA